MDRNKAIKKLLQKVKKDVLVQVVKDLAVTQPFNYTLQLLNISFTSATDPKQNWFTALGVLCIYQRFFAGEVLEAGTIKSGNPPMTAKVKKELIDAIASGCKLTKADAGRALD